MSTPQSYHPTLAIHPGATLNETLQALKMTKRDLAQRTAVTEKHVSAVVGGRASITSDFALKLEKTLSVPASFWNNLERNYQATLARLKQAEAYQEEYETLREYKETYQELVAKGILESLRWRVSNFTEIMNQLLDFFGTASLGIQDELSTVAFRRYDSPSVNRHTLAAMIRLGERFAREQMTAPFDEKKLRLLVPELPKLSRGDPEEYFPELGRRLAEVGVVLVCLPGFKKTGLQGASKWLSTDKAMIILKTRGQKEDTGMSEDKIWFTLCHEICHLLEHGRKQTFIDLEDAVDTPEEREANDFAFTALMPGFSETDLENYAEEEGISAERAITGEAERYAISPSIVAGQLEHLFSSRQENVYKVVSKYKKLVSYTNCV